MGRIKRGDYIFFTAVGDHEPRHVHIFKDSDLIARVTLDSWEVMTGTVDRRVRRLLEQLRKEGKL